MGRLHFVLAFVFSVIFVTVSSTSVAQAAPTVRGSPKASKTSKIQKQKAVNAAAKSGAKVNAKSSLKTVSKSTAKTNVKSKRRVVATVVEPPKPSYGELAGLHGEQDALDLKSSVALVLDQDTHEVLFSKNEKAVLPIASLTKLMTGLVVTDAG